MPPSRITTCRRASNLPIKSGQILLIDSGAQYEDGTTDITRTVIVGEPSAEMRNRFTMVLQGHHRHLARCGFRRAPAAARSMPCAPSTLWSAGLDYDHGTGHGVGSYLSVHEGPARLSKTDRIMLEPGMILSNEPGYYKEGALWHPDRESHHGAPSRQRSPAASGRCSASRR